MIEVIETALADLDIRLYDSDATEAVEDYYVLLVAPSVGRGFQDTLAGGGAINLIVRAVGIDPGHARLILAETRKRLRGLHAQQGGTRFAFHWDGCPRPVQVERIVRSDGTDTNMCWLDDEYTVFMEET